MKKTISLMLAGLMLCGALTACGGNDETGEQQHGGADAAADAAADAQPEGGVSGAITVISREDGSGTRGAFVELTGVEEKNDAGEKVDNTTADAEIASKTSVVLTSVAGNEKAIGYVSLGALNDTVKALKVDGAEATAEHVKDGSYTLARPFNIATKGQPTGVAADFMAFIMSADGQQIIEDEGYIKVNDAAEAFKTDGSSGQIAVGGSSSVSPVMEKLAEAYQAANPNAKIELQESDSTSGMTGAMDGTFDIGMASRELKEEESAALTGTAIAMDGIAVIVNPANTLEGLSIDQIKSVYVGDVTEWDELA
ncbi:MAG: substrate-binding domain-containing protein [Agathobaculum sp.]|jgi:phosphate transport system substrate-binding protein|uniref:substrate-binding domain-containing protein n=1 Tax=Agathobaculum sp. TaxID=2048138 RepID=UPI003D92DB1B